MLNVNDQVLLDDAYTVLVKLKEDVLLQTGKEYFKNFIIKNDNIQFCCLVHKGGQEQKPSCGMTTNTKQKSDGTFITAGTVHCFTCGYTASLPQMISYVFGKDDGGIFGLLHAQIQHLLVAVQCIKYPNGQDTPGYAHHHNAHQAHRSNGTQHLMAGLALAVLVLIGTRFARPAGLGLLNGLIRFAVHPVPCFLKAQAATSFIPQGEGENLRRRRKTPIGTYTVLL